MYREILVPLDGSKHAEAALPHARALARSFGSRILLVRAVTLPPLVGSIPEVALPPSIDAAAEKEAVRDYLEGLREALEAEGLAASIQVLDGPPGEAVLQCTRRTGVDLVVLSTHGRAGMRRWLHGSTAERITRKSPCPVLVVRPVHHGPLEPHPSEEEPPGSDVRG